MFTAKLSKKSDFIRRACFLSRLFFLLLFAVNVSAAKTIEDYGQGIQIARDSIDELNIYFTDAADEADGKDLTYERELLVLIRTNLPATEKIEWEGAVIETGNRWLSEKIDAYEKESNLTKRAEILTEVEERLAALQEKLAELNNAAASNRTKDEDKQKLAEILRREEYQKPADKQESIVQKWIREISEWLENIFPRPNVSESAPKQMQSVSVAMQIVLYVLVGAIIIFLLYKFAPVFVRRYRKNRKDEKSDRIILGERIKANESAADLFAEAERLARNEKIREAIRQGYIALLCDLSDRKIIGLAQHKTNRDYLRDVRRRAELHRKMRDLTDIFERHWYGLERADEKDWTKFQQEYKLAMNSKQ